MLMSTVGQLRVYFSCRPPEGITEPVGTKEVEKSAVKPNESSGEGQHCGSDFFYIEDG